MNNQRPTSNDVIGSSIIEASYGQAIAGLLMAAIHLPEKFRNRAASRRS